MSLRNRLSDTRKIHDNITRIVCISKHQVKCLQSAEIRIRSKKNWSRNTVVDVRRRVRIPTPLSSYEHTAALAVHYAYTYGERSMLRREIFCVFYWSRFTRDSCVFKSQSPLIATFYPLCIDDIIVMCIVRPTSLLISMIYFMVIIFLLRATLSYYNSIVVVMPVKFVVVSHMLRSFIFVILLLHTAYII